MDPLSKRIGIVGGGQLGKMMILEAKRLGFYVITLDPAADCPSHSISDELITASFDNEGAYHALAEKTDVITYEYEHINAHALESLEQSGHPVYPTAASLKTIQNKYTQKLTLKEAGIPVPNFTLIDGNSIINNPANAPPYHDSLFNPQPSTLNSQLSTPNPQLPTLNSQLSTLNSPSASPYPIMLKTTLGGYDGKGNALIRSEADAEAAFRLLGGGTVPLMAEEFVAFDREISIIATRGIDGSRVVYPPAENIHKNSILDITIVPARMPAESVRKATEIAHKVMEVFEGVGTFCVEMFLTKSGGILVNEVAPRPHNSGHYTIEGCPVNQFENHIRAITGLPLGNVELIKPTVMINLLGEGSGPARLTGLPDAYADPDIHVHYYGKAESKNGRKMGHLTATGATAEEALEKAARAKNLLKIRGNEVYSC